MFFVCFVIHSFLYLHFLVFFTGTFAEEFSRAVDLQTDLKHITLENARDLNASDLASLSVNILMTTAQDTVYLIESRLLPVEKLSLVIIDDCQVLKYGRPPFLGVIKLLRSQEQIPCPIIVGLSSNLPLSSSDELESMLIRTESVFGCHCSLSSDLVAMNRFGEQPHEKVLNCSVLADETNEKVKQVSSTLMTILGSSKVMDSASQLVNIRQECLLCCKILGYFGSCAAIHHVRLILKDISKLKKKLKNELERAYLLSWEAQLQSLLQISKKDEIVDITTLVKNIVMSLSYLKPKSTLDSRGTFASKENETAKVKSNTNQGYHGDIPVSIILCYSDQEAAVLNFLLNKLSKTNPELAFIHSRHISSNMIKQNDKDTDVDTDEGKNEDIIRLIREGQVNVLVICHNIENDVHLGQCKQVIRIGIPENYKSYVRVKKIPRLAHSEFIIFESEEKDDGDGMLQYKVGFFNS